MIFAKKYLNNGKQIALAIYTTIIGVLFDNEISWKNQITHTENKVSKGIGMQNGLLE